MSETKERKPKSKPIRDYVDFAQEVFYWMTLRNKTERKAAVEFGISKSNAHRCSQIARMDSDLLRAARKYAVEKYVLLEWDALPKGDLRQVIYGKIRLGQITRRWQLHKYIDENTKHPKGGESHEQQTSSTKGQEAGVQAEA